MMSLTFGLFTQVSDSGSHGPLVLICTISQREFFVRFGLFPPCPMFYSHAFDLVVNVTDLEFFTYKSCVKCF